MHGRVGISVRSISSVGVPHADLTDPKGIAVLSGVPQFIITAPTHPPQRGNPLLLMTRGGIGQFRQNDPAGRILAVVVAEGAPTDIQQLAENTVLAGTIAGKTRRSSTATEIRKHPNRMWVRSRVSLAV